MKTYGIELHMPSGDRVGEIVKSVTENHLGEKVTDESLEKMKAEIVEIIMAESDVKFNPAHS